MIGYIAAAGALIIVIILLIIIYRHFCKRIKKLSKAHSEDKIEESDVNDQIELTKPVDANNNNNNRILVDERNLPKYPDRNISMVITKKS